VVVNGSQSYAPYGEVFGTSGTMSSPFAFTGEPLDGNGLQYHRARYYTPAMGVWANRDFAETQNRYSYAQSNPVKWTDPSGLCVTNGLDTIACLTAAEWVLTGLVALAGLGTVANQHNQNTNGDFARDLAMRERDLLDWYNPFSPQGDSEFSRSMLTSPFGYVGYFNVKAIEGIGGAIERTWNYHFPPPPPTIDYGDLLDLVQECNSGWCNEDEQALVDTLTHMQSVFQSFVSETIPTESLHKSGHRIKGVSQSINIAVDATTGQCPPCPPDKFCQVHRVETGNALSDDACPGLDHYHRFEWGEPQPETDGSGNIINCVCWLIKSKPPIKCLPTANGRATNPPASDCTQIF